MLAYRDEVVIGCDAEESEATRIWLERTMVEGMNIVLARQGMRIQLQRSLLAGVAEHWQL